LPAKWGSKNTAKMSQDTVADALNMIRNAKKAGRESVQINRISNLLIEILKIMKQKGAIKRYKIDSKQRSIEAFFGDFLECRAIKPRFTADKSQIEKYRRRYLPARNVGTMIISTNKGLMAHEDAMRESIGGCLIAYFY
jgi:small subunit ribosomal protein S8